MWDDIDRHQGHVCFICGQKQKSGIRLATDHSHASGLVRGLLCASCNRILGKIEDPRFWSKQTVEKLLRAAEYLSNPPAVQALGKEVFCYPGKLGTKAHRKWLKKNK